MLLAPPSAAAAGRIRWLVAVLVVCAGSVVSLLFVSSATGRSDGALEESPELAARDLGGSAEEGARRPREAPLDVRESSDEGRVDAAAAEEAGLERVCARVELPPGTPADERPRVFGDASVPRGPILFDWVEVTARVRDDGSFCLFAPVGWSALTLQLEARYLELEGREVFRPGEPIVLRPRLRARIAGRVMAESGLRVEKARLRVVAAGGARADDGPLVVGRTPGTFDGTFRVPLDRFPREDLFAHDLFEEEPEPRGPRALSGTSPDPDGSFTVSRLPTGVPLEIELEHPEALPERRPVTLSPGETREVDLFLRPGVRVSGRLVDEDVRAFRALDEYVVQAWVTSGQDSEERLVQLTGCGEDGAFVFPNLPEGRLRLVAVGQRAGQDLVQTVQSGDVLEDVRLTLLPGAELSGFAVWENGDPVPNAEVLVSPGAEAWRSLGPGAHELLADADLTARSRADATGSFSAGSLAPGRTYEVRARLVGQRGAGSGSAVVVAAPASGVRLRLTGARIRAHLVDADGVSFHEHDVAVLYVDGEAVMPPWGSRAYDIPVLPGAHWIHATVHGHGHVDSPVQRVSVERGEVAEVRIVVRPSECILRGVLRSSEGEPKAGVGVRASEDLGRVEPRWGNQTLAWAVTDGEGRFELAGLPEGTIRLQAGGPGWGMATSLHELTRGAPLHVELTLEEPASLERTLEVVGPAGAVGTPALWWSRDGWIEGPLDVEDERCEVTLPGPGTYRVLALWDERLLETELVVDDAPRGTIRLAFGEEAR